MAREEILKKHRKDSEWERQLTNTQQTTTFNIIFFVQLSKIACYLKIKTYLCVWIKKDK
jgi:hypothetical protein